MSLFGRDSSDGNHFQMSWLVIEEHGVISASIQHFRNAAALVGLSLTGVRVWSMVFDLEHPSRVYVNWCVSRALAVALLLIQSWLREVADYSNQQRPSRHPIMFVVVGRPQCVGHSCFVL